jgi:hypothetical protein
MPLKLCRNIKFLYEYGGPMGAAVKGFFCRKPAVFAGKLSSPKQRPV